ncbi:MAG: STAS domain-containing protein [Myxococcales bacterium]|nr:STAS domain-containing protein [Myxococcales bacterium]
MIGIEQGRLDTSSGDTLERRVADALAAGASEVAVSCGTLALVDSSGLGSLVRSLKRCRAQGVSFKLLDVTKPLLRLLEMTRLASAFEMEHSSRSGAKTSV